MRDTLRWAYALNQWNVRLDVFVRHEDQQRALKTVSACGFDTIELASSGYEFCSEIVWRAKQQRLIVEEIPVRAIYTDYSLAKGQSNMNGITIVRNLVKRKVLDADA